MKKSEKRSKAKQIYMDKVWPKIERHPLVSVHYIMFILGVVTFAFTLAVLGAFLATHYTYPGSITELVLGILLCICIPITAVFNALGSFSTKYEIHITCIHLSGFTIFLGALVIIGLALLFHT